ncbi:hypothetical protein HPB51_012993 [Rhipicephalus microplus]|uniref:Uncharacterized protein n=1 Tax=Rhipicephalus microplus TaxID=6941 RepID=A0A9J6F2N5_RHIMP|nr:hypothetical protein HPB51_012993 [Rhipicephalus microplus]
MASMRCQQVGKKDQLGKLCSVLTHCVVAAPCPTRAEDLKPYIKEINTVAHFIKSLWTLSEVALRKTLDVVSTILTNSEDQFSPPLAAVVERCGDSLDGGRQQWQGGLDDAISNLRKFVQR